MTTTDTRSVSILATALGYISVAARDPEIRRVAEEALNAAQVPREPPPFDLDRRQYREV